MMKAVQVIVLASSVLTVGFSIGMPALSQSGQPVSRGFDYWHPDWMGGGDPGKALSPSPALLAYMIRRPISVDEYLLWSIADGGAQFKSKMPAFKGKLSPDDVWRVVAYMRAGFPKASGR